MRGIAFLSAALALSACIEDLGPAGDMVARDVAKGVVNDVVQRRFPGVNAAPYTDCIIDNATGAEIIQIAQGAALGANQVTTNLVTEIAARPDTVRCAIENSISLGGVLAL